MRQTTSKSLSTAFFGLYGCTGVLFTAFVPIVILLTIAYLGAVNPRLEDAGRLVSRWPGVLRRITLPLIAPAILFAAVLVFLLTLGEVGVPTYLRYPVYPVETLTQFAAFYDFSAATAAAIPLLLVTLAILALEYAMLHKQVSELRSVTFGGARVQIKLGPWRIPLLGIVFVWGVVTVALPLAVLIAQSSSLGAYADAFARASGSILRSLVFAVVGASLLTLLGFFCGYLIHNRTLPIWRGVDALTLFLFTLPGTVVGIGLISLWNTPMSNFIYRTPAIIILGYLAQYAVLPTRMTSAILDRIPRSLEQAAQLCGASWFMTLRHIVVPLAQTRPDCRVDHQLRVLHARPRGQHGGLSAGLGHLAGAHLDTDGQRHAELDCRALRHFDCGHTVSTRRGRSLVAASRATFATMIELRAVSKDYNGHRVIDSVSLKVETGERLVLFGPSGCGKSTVLHLIAGLILPDCRRNSNR